MKTKVSKIGSIEPLSFFVNSYDPEVNLVYYYFYKNNQISITLHPGFNYKNWVEKLGIESKISLNGNKIAYSDRLGLFAMQY